VHVGLHRAGAYDDHDGQAFSSLAFLVCFFFWVSVRRGGRARHWHWACLTFVYSYTSRYPTLANAQGCSMPHGRAYMFIDLRLQFWIQKQKFICLFQTSRVYVCCLVTELCVITTKPVSGYQKPPHENISNASVCMLAPKTVDPFRVTC
jgi:hypothetical protein